MNPHETSPKRLGLLIINGHLPIFPGTGGHEFLNTLNLARRAGHVGLVSMVHRQQDLVKAEAFREAGVELYLWQSPHLVRASTRPAHPAWLAWLHRQIASLHSALKTLPSRPRDTVVADLEFRNISGPLRTALSQRSWDAVVVIQSSAAATIRSIPRPLVSVLVMHDIRSRVLERQSRVSAGLWNRYWVGREARRYFSFERDQTRRYDLIVALSPDDAAWIRSHYVPARVAIVPVPVDASYFAPRHGGDARPSRIVFTGLMSHPPNYDAAIYFARDVFPGIRAQCPTAEFLVVGKHPTPEVVALKEIDGVDVTGEVPDTRPYLQDATVVVVPLRFGSGVRNKILEAWCMEKFVVSTTLGAEGLEYRDNVNLAIADDASTMTATIVRAFRDEAYRDRLRTAGRTVAIAAHNPDQIGEKYYRAIAEVVAEKISDNEPMRIALDMRWMVPGVAGGLEQLARAFLTELMAIDRCNLYTAILPAQSRHDFALEHSANIRAVSLDSTSAYVRSTLRRIRRLIYGRLRLDDPLSDDVVKLRWLASLNADIAYSFPGYIHPDLLPLRHVLVVPDIQHEYFPRFFSEQAVAERRRLYGDSIRRADHICAISEFTRQSLIERLDVRPDRVTTVPLAADAIFQAADMRRNDTPVLSKYRLQRGRYVFFPAHTWRHKNHLAALGALRVLREKHGLAPELICTGGAREAQPELAAAIEQFKLPVRFLGYCEREELPALYRQAAALVFPSLFEGFGMPVLEAMACGCPVVCSNTTSLPEIAGDAAVLVDPTDPEALADGLASVLTSVELRQELVARGLLQAAKFSWRRYTIETLHVLQRVHKEVRTVQG